MPKNSPVVFIVGHGTTSGKGNIIDYGNYHVILLHISYLKKTIW